MGQVRGDVEDVDSTRHLACQVACSTPGFHRSMWAMPPGAAVSSLASRLGRLVRREDDGRGHWFYLGPLHPSGYARICADGRQASVSQAVWWLSHGYWPTGRLRRICDGGVRCVASAHHREGKPVGRQRELRPPRPLRFTADDVRAIRAARDKGVTYAQLAKMFHAPIGTLSGIVSRRIY